MIVLIAALAGPALASGVLYGEAGLAPLESLALEARVTGRVAEVTATFRFDAAPGAWTFAASLPADAAVAGLRLQAGEGEWIEASASAAPADGDGDSAEDGAAPEGLPGAVFTAALPETDAAGVAVELRWQRLLAASGGALTLEIPLDDGGLNPGDPPASLVAEVAALDPVLEAWLEGGEVAVDGDRIRAQWQGGLGDALALGWSEDAAELGVTLLSYRPEEDPFTGEAPGAGYALAVIRPGPVDDGARVEQLFTFVLDVSSSMAGAPLEAATEAGGRWLESLEAGDRFNVVPYASQPYPFLRRAAAAESETVREARDFMEGQSAAGLSDPEEAVSEALALTQDTLLGRTFFGCSGTARAEGGPPLEGAEITDPGAEVQRVAPYVVLLTDGGASTGETDPDAISAAVAAANTAGASLFAVGVGGGVDLELLERLTAEHRGEVALAAGPDEVVAAVATLQDRIRDPLLVRPQVAVEGAWGQAPEALADLAAGYELLVAFRWDTPGAAALTLTGIRGQDDLDQSWQVRLPEVDGRYPAVALGWAQLRVGDLDARYRAGETSLYDEIEALVRDYGVASDVVTLSFAADAAADGGLAYDAASGCQIAPVTRSAAFHLAALLVAALARRRRRGPGVG